MIRSGLRVRNARAPLRNLPRFDATGADGAPRYRLETLDDWIARIKARGHAMLEEKLSLFRAPRGRSAWGVYALPLRSQRNFAAEAAGKSAADVVAEVVVQRGWREA